MGIRDIDAVPGRSWSTRDATGVTDIRAGGGEPEPGMVYRRCHMLDSEEQPVLDEYAGYWILVDYGVRIEDRVASFYNASSIWSN